jgi:hypothetical protein
MINDGAKFCNICGASLSVSTTIPDERNEARVSSDDAQEIISRVRESYASIPLIARPLIPPLPNILKTIPGCARKYTLQQIIDLIEEAHARGEI